MDDIILYYTVFDFIQCIERLILIMTNSDRVIGNLSFSIYPFLIPILKSSYIIPHTSHHTSYINIIHHTSYLTDMRRHPRPILRPRRTLQSRRRMPRQKLPIPRRLCRPRLLLRRNLPPPPRPQSTLPRPHNPHPRQPRITPNHPSLRLLR